MGAMSSVQPDLRSEKELPSLGLYAVFQNFGSSPRSYIYISYIYIYIYMLYDRKYLKHTYLKLHII